MDSEALHSCAVPLAAALPSRLGGQLKQVAAAAEDWSLALVKDLISSSEVLIAVSGELGAS